MQENQKPKYICWTINYERYTPDTNNVTTRFIYDLQRGCLAPVLLMLLFTSAAMASDVLQIFSNLRCRAFLKSGKSFQTSENMYLITLRLDKKALKHSPVQYEIVYRLKHVIDIWETNRILVCIHQLCTCSSRRNHDFSPHTQWGTHSTLCFQWMCYSSYVPVIHLLRRSYPIERKELVTD